MKKDVKIGEELEIFSKEVLESIDATVMDCIINIMENEKNIKPIIYGGFVLKDIPTLNNENVNIWIEFDGKNLPGEVVDAGINRCIIFEEFTDEIMDRYNLLCKTFKSQSNI